MIIVIIITQNPPRNGSRITELYRKSELWTAPRASHPPCWFHLFCQVLWQGNGPPPFTSGYHKLEDSPHHSVMSIL